MNGEPRFLFVRIAREPKPLYVDLASPVYVDILAWLARAADRIDLSEMLPTHDQTRLADRQGRRYTCELRAVAVDPEPRRPFID